MKSSTLFFLKYLAVWVILSVLYFVASETITKWIAPGYHNIQIWLSVVLIGLLLIVILLSILFFVGLRKRKKNLL
jgi:small-conductance mechanosensitive channel